MNGRDFDNLVSSVKQAGSIKRGQLQPGRTTQVDPAEIKLIRKKLDKSQSEFALMIGVSVSTLQNWEQDAAILRALLKIASENPDAVTRLLGA